MSHPFGRLHPDERRCRVCDCSEWNACIDGDGGTCFWVADDLCSECAPPLLTQQAASTTITVRPVAEPLWLTLLVALVASAIVVALVVTAILGRLP